MIIYKDILQKLKDAGYNTTRLRREKLLPQSTITRLRNNDPITTETLGVICHLTGLPVEDLIEYQEK
jgi:putative transcriptional regulator|nr:MAG TPA: Cro/C1-type HTH DNA-binding domain protein [Caudoviricetes sp.]